MKANQKGLGGIKMLLLAHGEKLGIAVVGAIALVLVYKSIVGQEYLPDNRQADDLQQQIRDVSNKARKSVWKDAPPAEVRKVQPLAQTDDRTVDVNAYQSNSRRVSWNTPLVPPTVLRIDPVLFEAQDIEGYGGSGNLAFADEAIRRRRQLEQRAEQERVAQRRQEEQERMERNQDSRGDRGRGRGRGRGNARDQFGRGNVDPDHPNRRAVVGRGGSTGIPLNGDEEVVTAYWATVVAKVPIKDQIRAFRDVFENARGYNEAVDFPTYLGFFVQRAEVRPGQEKLDWKRVSVYNGKGKRIGGYIKSEFIYGSESTDTAAVGTNATRRQGGIVNDWAAMYPEVVDQRYLDPSGVLAVPLPPLVGRDWGDDLVATHSEIPLASEGVELEDEQQPIAEEADPIVVEEEDEFSFSGNAGPNANQGRGMGGMGRGMGGMGGYPGMGGRGGMEGGMGGYPGRGGMGGRGEYGGMEGGMGGYGGMTDGMDRGMGGGYGGASRGGRGGANVMPLVSDWLLRFFDFNVRPGKKYKYRVRLVLQDPNQNQSVTKATLDSSVLNRIKEENAGRSKPPQTPIRLTEWSQPSRTVSIPQAGTVRLVSADVASDRSFTNEPDVRLLVESFGEDEGKAVQAAEEKEFKRGYVANMTMTANILVEQNRFIDEQKGFEFRTGITVVDIRGGERLTGDTETEARVLLMGPAGQLFVQIETDDADAVARHQAIFADPDEGRPGGRGGFPGRGGDGRGNPGRGGGGELDMMDFGR